MPDLDTFRVLPYAPHTGAVLDRPHRARRRAGAGVPALVPQADGGAARRARRACSRSRSRTSSRWRREVDGAYVPIDSGPLLLDDRHDRGAGLRRRPRRVARRAAHRSSSSTTPSSATASTRSRPRTRRRCRPPTSSCSCARRSAASPRGTASSPRSRRSRGPTTPATAATSTSRCGTSTARATASTTPAAPDGLSAEARSFVAGVLAHLPGAVRPDRAELQLVPPHRPAVLGRARSSAGATTTARRRCACRRCSRAPRRRRRTSS